MNTRQMMETFYGRDDADAAAQQFGWSDLDQMCYYEDRDMEVPPMTDREAEELVEREEAIVGEVAYIAPPPINLIKQQQIDVFEIHELDKIDPREVYNLNLFSSSIGDMAGVY